MTVKEKTAPFCNFLQSQFIKKGGKKTLNEFILNWDTTQSSNLIISMRHNRYIVGSNVDNITIKT